MKLKFKIQQYQTDAVENVVNVFDGQPNRGLLEYKIDHGKVYVEQGGKRVEVKEFEYDEEKRAIRTVTSCSTRKHC